MRLPIGKLDALCDAALSLLYPQRCEVCRRESVERRRDAPACALCWERTRIFSDAEPCCWKCGAPPPQQDAASTSSVAAARRVETGAGLRAEARCHRCDDECYTAARAVGVYEGALRAAVLLLKREPYVGGHLAQQLVETQQRPPLAAATCIIPVPLHTTRQRARGFNQSLIIGRALAALTGLALDDHSLIRAKHTTLHRAGLDARARRESVDGVFCVQRPRLVAGERILLIDDVLTTGATVSSCAQALLKAGAREVFVLTIARA